MQNAIMFFQLLPAIIQALMAIESAIPGQGEGEKKLALVRSLLETVDVNSKAMWPTISAMITLLVKTFNETGAFKK